MIFLFFWNLSSLLEAELGPFKDRAKSSSSSSLDHPHNAAIRNCQRDTGSRWSWRWSGEPPLSLHTGEKTLCGFSQCDFWTCGSIEQFPQVSQGGQAGWSAGPAPTWRSAGQCHWATAGIPSSPSAASRSSTVGGGGEVSQRRFLIFKAHFLHTLGKNHCRWFLSSVWRKWIIEFYFLWKHHYSFHTGQLQKNRQGRHLDNDGEDDNRWKKSIA